ncbi:MULTISPECIES: hypothetical protein [unclassified Halorubrum]|uniref:hypothetical protein n=1 Tax=unclassified Halorubrum TaxID=2642239 RepID=UPI000B98C536|nr:MULTISPECIES: hypothetical protein [unclassified Halorubrum]OYR39976.1 hypothetical protein DJ81_15105 [Halorubrum sp. Hd13]OYR50549.1 hypothetical protein DJ74_06120 [Halorubrum sp. Ea8]OYR53713.1 hypothetical protein DJ73_06930 [Halorubrum sp. Ea1]
MTGSADGPTGPGESNEAPELRIPRGTLLRSRVVSDVATTLSRALDRGLTGYATIVPQETLLLEGDARGVLTFADGVPVLAYNTVTDSGGPDALAELAVPGPYRVELYAVDGGGLDAAHEADALRVAPGAAATELADDPALADRTRDAAPDERLDDPGADDADAVAAFLADDDRIEAIREQARAEAAERADEWGLDAALADEHPGGDDPNADLATASESGPER